MPATSAQIALRLHLHGPFRATGADGGDIPGLSRRAQAMLAFLATTPGMRAERARLADLLWSDRGADQARASLRQELSVMRRTLPDDVIGADRQQVRLDPARVEVMGGAGEFLDGFDLASEAFEDWLRSCRMAQDAEESDAPGPTGPPRATPQAHSQPVLAVLPFAEIGAPEADMFADGVVEEITGALARVHDFDVIARQSAFALDADALSVPDAARELGADYIVEGSVRRAGDRVRISVQLVRGRDGHLIWSERFDDRLDDLFDLQDRIAAQVAGQVAPHLKLAEIDRIDARPPQDRTAYELMLTAMPHFWALRSDSNPRAIDLLGQAIDRDPEFVHAIALKAWAHAQQVTYMWSGDPVGERKLALDLATRAAERVRDHAPAMAAIAGAYAQAGSDQMLARTFIDRTLGLDPNNAWAWIRRGWIHQYVGEVDAAMAAFDQAERLSPLDPFLHQITFGKAATVYRWDEDPTEGLRMIEDGLRRHPGVVWPLRMLAAGYVRLGRMDRAQAAAGQLMATLPHLTIGYLRDCLPPIAIHMDDGYFAQLQAAGIPA